MEKLRIGIVGAGNIAQSAHMPAYQKRDDVEIVAFADINLERAQEAAKKFNVPHAFASVEEMLANVDVDIVDICVWNGGHAPVAIAAAEAGKHVMCEKPMAVNLEAALKMEEAIRKSGKTFMLAVPTRYSTEAQYVHQMVMDGQFGEIYHARVSGFRRRGTPKGWFTDLSKSGGGPVIDILVHSLDRMWFMMGRPKPVRISAMTSHRIGDYQTKGVNRWVALDSDVTAFDTEDSAGGIIHFENGAILIVETSWAMNIGNNAGGNMLCGSKAGATFDPLTIYSEENGYLVDKTPTLDKVGIFDAEIEHFLDCVRTGKTPCSSIDDAITVQRMLQGIYDSAKLGREVIL